jgi:pseudouridine-5'-phosphate glycosidase
VHIPSFYHITPEVTRTLAVGGPVVALESTVITHGLPYPENLQLAQNMERTVRKQGVTPATVAVMNGKIYIGLNTSQLKRLAQGKDTRKVSVRDFAPAITQKATGGTTVAGTLVAASTAGLRVFATGGIGGVHRQSPYDISADLTQLARTQMVVICAGAKAILDLPATLEVLETLGVPVLGYQTDEFPAFYSRRSGLSVSVRVDTPQEIADIARTHWQLGASSALLIANPPPVDEALPLEAVESAIQQALNEVQTHGLRGQGVTPFLLRRVSELTEGESLRANLALLLNNARLAAQIALALAKPGFGTL